MATNSVEPIAHLVRARYIAEVRNDFSGDYARCLSYFTSPSIADAAVATLTALMFSHRFEVLDRCLSNSAVRDRMSTALANLLQGSSEKDCHLGVLASIAMARCRPQFAAALFNDTALAGALEALIERATKEPLLAEPLLSSSLTLLARLLQFVGDKDKTSWRRVLVAAFPAFFQDMLQVGNARLAGAQGSAAAVVTPIPMLLPLLQVAAALLESEEMPFLRKTTAIHALYRLVQQLSVLYMELKEVPYGSTPSLEEAVRRLSELPLPEGSEAQGGRRPASASWLPASQPSPEQQGAAVQGTLFAALTLIVRMRLTSSTSDVSASASLLSPACLDPWQDSYTTLHAALLKVKAQESRDEAELPSHLSALSKLFQSTSDDGNSGGGGGNGKRAMRLADFAAYHRYLLSYGYPSPLEGPLCLTTVLACLQHIDAEVLVGALECLAWVCHDSPAAIALFIADGGLSPLVDALDDYQHTVLRCAFSLVSIICLYSHSYFTQWEPELSHTAILQRASHPTPLGSPRRRLSAEAKDEPSTSLPSHPSEFWMPLLPLFLRSHCAAVAAPHDVMEFKLLIQRLISIVAQGTGASEGKEEGGTSSQGRSRPGSARRSAPQPPGGIGFTLDSTQGFHPKPPTSPSFATAPRPLSPVASAEVDTAGDKLVPAPTTMKGALQCLIQLLQPPLAPLIRLERFSPLFPSLERLVLRSNSRVGGAPGTAALRLAAIACTARCWLAAVQAEALLAPIYSTSCTPWTIQPLQPTLYALQPAMESTIRVLEEQARVICSSGDDDRIRIEGSTAWREEALGIATAAAAAINSALEGIGAALSLRPWAPSGGEHSDAAAHLSVAATCRAFLTTLWQRIVESLGLIAATASQASLEPAGEVAGALSVVVEGLSGIIASAAALYSRVKDAGPGGAVAVPPGVIPKALQRLLAIVEAPWMDQIESETMPALVLSAISNLYFVAPFSQADTTDVPVSDAVPIALFEVYRSSPSIALFRSTVFALANFAAYNDASTACFIRTGGLEVFLRGIPVWEEAVSEKAYQCVCRMANATWQWILHRFQQFKGAGAGNGSSVQDAAAAALAVEAFGFDPEAETLEDALDQFLPVLNGLLFHGTVATAAKERVAFSDWAADHASALALPVFMRVITGEIPPDLLTYALTVLYNLFQGAPKQLREEAQAAQVQQTLAALAAAPHVPPQDAAALRGLVYQTLPHILLKSKELLPLLQSGLLPLLCEDVNHSESTSDAAVSEAIQTPAEECLVAVIEAATASGPPPLEPSLSATIGAALNRVYLHNSSSSSSSSSALAMRAKAAAIALGGGGQDGVGLPLSLGPQH